MEIVNVIFIRFIQRLDDCLQMRVIINEVSMAYIYKQCFCALLTNVIGIGVLNIGKIFIWDILLVGSVSFFDIGLLLFYGRVKINQ